MNKKQILPHILLFLIHEFVVPDKCSTTKYQLGVEWKYILEFMFPAQDV